MQQSPSWEALMSSASQEFLRSLWYPNVHYHIQKLQPHLPILIQIIPVHSSASHFLETNFSFNIIFPSTHRSSKWSLSVRSPHQNPVRSSPVPIHATCPSHLIFLDFITRILFDEQYGSFSSSICSFLHSPVTSSLLGLNILLSTLFSNILSLCSSFSITQTKFHTHTNQQAQFQSGSYLTYHWRMTQISTPYKCQLLKVLRHPLMGVCHFQWLLLTQHCQVRHSPRRCDASNVHPCIFHIILWGVRDILSFRSFTWQCIHQAKLQSFNAGTWLRMRGNCALGRGEQLVMVAVVVVVVRGKIFCLRLKACRGSRGIAPFITILGTRWRFGVGIATCYGLDGPGSNPGGALFSAPVQTGPGAHPASCTMGTGSLLGGKAARAWRWPHTPSAPMLRKEYSHTSTPPSGPSWPVLG